MTRYLLLALVGCAHSAAPTTTPPSALGARLSSLAFYVGEWTCEGTDETGARSKDYPVLDVRVAPAFANWISIEVWDHGTQGTSELLGVDDKGLFHHVWTDSDGGHGSLTAPGWTGDILVLNEDQPSATSKTRMTLKRVDDTHYVHVAEVDHGTGFRTEFTKTCRKV